MFANLIGAVDLYSASVLIAFAVTFCVVITAMIIKRRSRQDVANEFELAKIKQHDENHRLLFAAETERRYKIGQLEQNLITSHRQENPNNG